MTYPVLTASTFLPSVGAALIFLCPVRLARWIALVTTIATLAVSAPLYLSFDKTSSALQFVESRPWIPSWNVAYGMGVDGISLPFIGLSAFVSVLCVAVSWNAIQVRVWEFYATLLVAETAMIGLFAATNFFLFYMFWELMVVPMFLLIGVWGGTGRVHAALKFLIFTLAGSLLMLVGLISLLHTSGTLDFEALARTDLGLTQQAWLFVAFSAAFAVKVPMFPVHTWLPDAHTEAPTAGSVILAGILLKMGGYGLLRIALPILSDAVRLFLTPMLVLSGVAIVYGAYVTLAQTDIKRLIAYSSISHMGFVTLGIFSLDRSGIEGAILQMINHGIITGALFLCVGMIYERTHTRDVAKYGGLFKVAPIYSTFLAIFCLAAAGTPGLNSFVGEFLIILGAIRVWPLIGAMAVWGVALGAAYVLWLFYRMVIGELGPGVQGVRLDLNIREVVTLAPLVALAVVIGLYPESVLGVLRGSVTQLLADVASSGGIAGRP
ncbi:NADH-quinone oxidoreductase subunit M [Luteitalea pratensis]|uniref:NADH-quinone oxidoreductase subunit M n=1 Tax=Luteitalea pratensis TaxID=1855912 RepID=A0A143PEE3_LUTPR|nr:NADH-quinone oxidoreductase subunit M [Luteitalea pratensis]AMY06942.1 NADH-quinone oxidoreductase subunit M [Luteitalea pratensis]